MSHEVSLAPAIGKLQELINLAIFIHYHENKTSPGIEYDIICCIIHTVSTFLVNCIIKPRVYYC